MRVSHGVVSVKDSDTSCDTGPLSVVTRKLDSQWTLSGHYPFV